MNPHCSGAELLLVSDTGNKQMQDTASQDELSHLGNAFQELFLKIILLSDFTDISLSCSLFLKEVSMRNICIFVVS